MLYVPDFFVRFVRRRFSEAKHRELVKALEAARLEVSPARFYAISLFYALLAVVPGALLGFLIASVLPESLEFPFRLPEISAPVKVSLPFRFEVSSSIFVLLFAVIAFFLTRYLILSYPFYSAKLRAGKIDAVMPHAVNTMLGMIKGGVSLYAAFKFVAENRQIFDELSREFEKIVTLVEVFGYDLVSAIHFVADTTPSFRLQTFLSNLLNVYESGGDVVEYLRSKSEQLLTERETIYNVIFETLQIFSEIYLALFVVAPLFFLITLVVFQIMGSTALEIYRYAIYILVPFGSLVVALLVQNTLPGEKRIIVKVERFEEPLIFRIKKEKPEFRFSRFRRFLNRVKSFLLQPFSEDVYALSFRAVFFYILLPPAAFAAFAHDKLSLDEVVFFSAVALIAPSIVFVEYRNRVIRKIERELPDFLKQLASLNEAGLNVVEALRRLSEAELGVLSKEIRATKRAIEWGELVTSAFKKLEARVNSELVSRAMSILVKSIEATPNVRDALAITSTYSELEVVAKDRIRAQMFMYVIIIYLAFAVFLYTSYILLANMLSVFGNLNVAAGGVTLSVNIGEIKKTFFETSLIVGAFSGLIAGVIGEGRVEAGLKHLLILLVMTYAFFKYIVP
ncbi:MAG: type II secretion system F family protein [Archaeoglobaceae archaeon]